MYIKRKVADHHGQMQQSKVVECNRNKQNDFVKREVRVFYKAKLRTLLNITIKILRLYCEDKVVSDVVMP